MEKRTVVICPNCRAKLGVRKGITKSHIACPRCKEEIPVVPAGMSTTHDAPPVEQLRRAAAPASGWSWWGFGGAIAAVSVWGLLLLAGSAGRPFVSAVLGATCCVYVLLIVLGFLGDIGFLTLAAAEACAEGLTGEEVPLVSEASSELDPVVGWLCGLVLLVGAAVGWHANVSLAHYPKHTLTYATAGVVVLGWFAGGFVQGLVQRRADARSAAITT